MSKERKTWEVGKPEKTNNEQAYWEIPIHYTNTTGRTHWNKVVVHGNMIDDLSTAEVIAEYLNDQETKDENND